MCSAKAGLAHSQGLWENLSSSKRFISTRSDSMTGRPWICRCWSFWPSTTRRNTGSASPPKLLSLTLTTIRLLFSKSEFSVFLLFIFWLIKKRWEIEVVIVYMEMGYWYFDWLCWIFDYVIDWYALLSALNLDYVNFVINISFGFNLCQRTKVLVFILVMCGGVFWRIVVWLSFYFIYFYIFLLCVSWDLSHCWSLQMHGRSVLAARAWLFSFDENNKENKN